MSFCSFADGAAMFDVTPIENIFLIEYMGEAPAPALKLYLYARMVALHPELGSSIADACRALRMDEDAIVEAFAHWEHRGLVRRVSDNPPAFELLPLSGQGAASVDGQMYALRDFHIRLQGLFGENMIDDHGLRKVGDWLSVLGYDQDAALRLVEYGISTSRSRAPKPASVFKRMDRLAEAWSRRGVRTLEDVERAIADETGIADVAKAALAKLGLSRQPTVPELESVRRWMGEWGYDREAILQACDETTNARNPSFAYLEAILQKRLEGGDDAHRQLVEVLRELRPRDAQPSPDDEQRYRALLVAGFAPALIQLAAVQCHRQGQHTFDDLEWRLADWREENLNAPEEAEAYMKELAAYKRQLRAVMKKAGMDRAPSREEIKTYRAWRQRYPSELIDFAAECTARRGWAMPYMEAMLERWQQAGATTVEAARQEREAWKAGHAASAEPGRAANPALDYQQRDYKDEDFGDDFYVDLSSYAKGEGKA